MTGERWWKSRWFVALFDAPHRPVLVAGWICLVLLLATSAFLVGRLLASGGVLPDFTVFWAAARDIPAAYDAPVLTTAQSFAVRPAHRPRLFVYPPPALLIVAPFG